MLSQSIILEKTQISSTISTITHKEAESCCPSYGKIYLCFGNQIVIMKLMKNEGNCLNYCKPEDDFSLLVIIFH